MAKQTEAKARPAATTTTSARPPRARPASVPAFGGWEGGAAAPDYSLDFTNIRAARMQRRKKALSWSSFVGNAAVAVETTPDDAAGAGEDEKRQWSRSSAASSDGDDDDGEQRRHHRLRRLRSDTDDRQMIQPRRAAPPKGSGKFKGYLFGCVSGQW